MLQGKVTFQSFFLFFFLLFFFLLFFFAGKVTFQSFLLFGSLPLVPIMVALLLPNSDSQVYRERE
jgi:hypothetical protein